MAGSACCTDSFRAAEWAAEAFETQSSTHYGRLLPVCRTFCELFSTFGGGRQLVANDFRLFFAKSACPAHFWRVFGKVGRLVFDT